MGSTYTAVPAPMQFYVSIILFLFNSSSSLLILSVFTFIKQKTLLSIELKNMLWFCITFTLLLFIIIGTTTPVSGALVRYKVPALPFLAIAILTFLDVDYLTTKIPFLKFLK